MRHVTYLSNGDVRVISDHDKKCLEGVSEELKLRYERKWLPEFTELNNPYLKYLREHVNGRPPYQNDSTLTQFSDSKYYRPKDVNLAIKSSLMCARDHKWRLVVTAIDRKECDCVTFFKVVIAVYRLWKCASTGILDDLGFASINEPYYGQRDYWFPRQDRSKVVCIFPTNTTSLNLTHGAIFTRDITKVLFIRCS
jgi:hypothetical protein